MAPLISTLADAAGPLAARSLLLGRDEVSQAQLQDKIEPGDGVVGPEDINNTFVFVLFGLIGAGLVCTGIWFFFWAKNGGFYFREDDWDDYKSTVLRRKGPNGTILSGATPSTQLGGGSIYKDYDEGSTEYTGGLTQHSAGGGDTASTYTGITGGVSDFAGRERRRQKREKKEREREKKKDRKNRERAQRDRSAAAKAGGRHEDGALVDEAAEAAAQDQLRAYRHEKAARVGGLNKASEGSEWDGSTNPDRSTVSASSELLSSQHRQSSSPSKRKSRRSTTTTAAGDSDVDTGKQPEMSETKPKKPAGGGGIRKVYSAADRTAHREKERLRAEARRLAEKGRGARRDFSWQRSEAPGPIGTIEEESSVGGGTYAGDRSRGKYLPASTTSGYADGTDDDDGDLGTKSYHHVIPGLSTAGSAVEGSSVAGASDYAEERRKKRGVGRYRREE
ncbi:hypothetical protein F4780DRAFT_251027 [Xylariomycetidae sp. FL0641]|nr:hypothetical protein F4780DRAFT_251027 [Xylariomycetidae sp. FL0641]